MLKAVKTFSILGVISRFTTINAPLMKKIVITFIDLPYVLLLQCKYNMIIVTVKICSTNSHQKKMNN